MQLAKRPQLTLYVPETKVAPSAEPLHTPVYELLKELILSGRIPPGTKLKEEEVSARLSVSRTPLREALSRLAQDKLVRIVPRRGAHVADYTKSEIIEILTVREVLEGLAARLAAQSLDEATLARLRQLMDPARLAELLAHDRTEIARADQKFHAALYRATRNERLIEIMSRLNDQTQLVRMKTMILPDRLEHSLHETQAMIEAITARDPDAAEARAREHIRSAREAVLRHYPDDP